MPLTKSDLTRPPNLEKEHATGPFRIQSPVYRNLLPPCNHACPTGEDIQSWLAFSQAGHFQKAWLALTKNNPFPAISGRICYHNCETACNRAELDQSVSIHAVERFLGDLALEKNWQFESTIKESGKKIMVVGAGPCGLAAAYHLRLLGHEVAVFEAGPIAGGLMHFGIPVYRLPREVLAAEVKRIENFGVQIHLNHPVDDIEQERSQGQFDAVLLAIGAKLSNRIDIPGCDAEKMLDAMGYLQRVASNEPVKIGRRVAVYGGGNTAMDAARTARRQGAEETMIIYRNDREHMPAHDFEAEEAISEDVKIHWLRRIREMRGGELIVEVMSRDESGHLQPTGEIETLLADTLILAIGQNVDSKFLAKMPEIIVLDDGSIEVNSQLMTAKDGVFAGGDMVPGQRSATHAFGYGKRAARNIDAWLRGAEITAVKPKGIVRLAQLHLTFRSDAPQKSQPKLPVAERVDSFAEVLKGLTADEVQFEAGRCFSCGNCFECDGCMAACPQRAIAKLGVDRGYQIDYDLCSGCGVCVEQCPCDAMEMVTESAKRI